MTENLLKNAKETRFSLQTKLSSQLSNKVNKEEISNVCLNIIFISQRQ